MTSTARPRVLIVGSSNTDLVIACDRLPTPGETLSGGKFQRFPGGKGANQAVAAARAGARAVFIGARGNDDFGKEAAKALQREGVDIRHFSTKDGISSGIALIFVGGKTRENMIAVAHSCNETLSPRDIQVARLEFQKAAIVVAQLEIPVKTVMKTAELAQKNQIPFLLNPAPGRRLPVRLLRLVHTLTPNEHEAALLTGESCPEKAAGKLIKWGCKNVVITLGAAGALLVNADGLRLFPAPKVKPVDTVGAGDCFTGWLAVGMAQMLDLATAIRQAVRAAASSVCRPGAQSSFPHHTQLKRF